VQAKPITAGALAAAGSGSGDGAPAEAVQQALAGVGGDAALVLFFPSNLDPDTAAQRAAGTAGGVPLAGMTGSGAIAPGGAIEHGASAIAFARGARIGIGHTRGAGRALARAARHAAAEALRSVGVGYAITLLLFLDTRSGDQADAVAGAYAAAGPRVPLVGGGAGGDEPAQIIGSSAYRDSVVAVAIGTERPAGVGHAHGCRPRGAPAIATRSDGRYLYELDGRPAAEVYLERLGYAGADLGREEFHALSVTHPLAQPELNGSSRLRHVLDRGPAGSLECATHIPPNAAVDFTHQSPGDIVDSSGRAVCNALANLGVQPRAALVFDCAGRKRAVADSLALEVDGIMAAFGDEPPPMAGLFSHGEVFRLRGAKGDRNHAVVVATFA
jgi:hypothetical protein